MKSHLSHRRCARLHPGIQVIIAALFLISPTLAQEPQPDIRDLVLDQAITRKVAGLELHIYGIGLKQGQVLRVSLHEKGADVAMTIIMVANQQRVSAASNGGSGFMRESVTFSPSQDGIYALVIRAQQVGEAEPGYELTASVAQSTQQDTQRAQAEKLLEEGVQGTTSSDQNSLLASIKSFNESIRLWQLLADQYWEGIARIGLAAAYMKLPNNIKAEENLAAAQKIFEKTGDESELATVCINFGVLYAMDKNLEKAQPYLLRAVQISRRVGDKRAESLLGLVAAAPVLGDVDTSVKSNYAEELSTARAKNDKNTEAAIWAKAVLRYAVDEESMSIAEAKVFLDRAEREGLPLVRSLHENNLELMIVAGLGIGFYDLTLSPDSNETSDRAYKEKSMRYVREGLAFARTQNNQLMQALLYDQLNLYYDGDNNGLAIFYAKQSLNSLHAIQQDLKVAERETQQDVARKLEEVYDELASDLISQGRLDEAHQVANLGRDQEFFDFKLIQNSQSQRVAMNRRESEAERALETTLQSTTTKYGSSDYQSAGRDLRATFVSLENSFDDVTAKERALNVTDTSDMKSALRELNAKTGQKHVVLYVLGDVSDNSILLITPENIMGFTGGSASENRGVSSADPEEDVTQFLKVLESPTLDPRPLGAILYNRIFKAKSGNNILEAELRRSAPDVILWSVGGRLRYVPVAALYDSDKGEYLVEKYQNVVFTRARKERFSVEPRPWTQGLGLGTSVAYEGFTSLPGVVEELSTIFGDAAGTKKGLINGRVFMNDAFTRQTLNSISSTKPALVHIASHFKFKAGDSRNSFLLLGDGSRLSLFDMQQNLNLFAGVDLLTLSACDTAAQQANAAGIEIDGFAELAQRLGANSVIATLWKISDNGTSKLMTEFYRLHQENSSMSKGALLRQAQLNLLKGKVDPTSLTRNRVVRGTYDTADTNSRTRIPFKPPADVPFAHPYYWAPFVLYGSSR